MSVVLVARSQERLRAPASDLSGQYKIRAEVISADLSQEGASQQIRDEVKRRGIMLDMLVNNAGFATRGSFEEMAPERDHGQVMVNVAAVVDLTHAFIPDLLAHAPEAAIINVASIGAFQPLPYMAVYGATKAFILSFSQALFEEYRTRGLRVLALCPGSTETSFFTVANTSPIGRTCPPEQVVATGLHALERGRSVVIEGRANALLAQSVRFFPRQFVAHLAGRRMGHR
jgi:short-subunit dehydrogenase